MANQQLLDYIKKRLMGGAKKEEIKDALVKEGWQTTDVDAGFKEAGLNGEKGFSGANFKKPAIIAAAVVVLVILVAGGFYVFKKSPSGIIPGLGGTNNKTKSSETIVRKISSVPAGFQAVANKIAFSSDGSRVGFVAQDTKDAGGDNYYVFLNDKKAGPYEQVDRLTFSPDGAKFVYIAAKDGKEFVVVDGEEGQRYDKIGGGNTMSRNILINRSNDKIAYIGQKGGKYFVVINGKPGEGYDSISNFRLVSKAGEDVFYIAKQGGRSVSFLNNEITDKDYSGNGNFSATAPARLENKDGKQMAVIGGKEGKLYDSLVFDSNRYFLYTRGAENRKTAYIAKEGEKEFAVLEDKEGGRYDAVTSLTFSDDGQSLAYAARTGGNWQLVVDGKEIDGLYNSIRRIAFGPNNKPAFIGQKNGELQVVYDGQESPTHELIGALFFDNGKIMYGIKDGNDFNLVTQ